MLVRFSLGYVIVTTPILLNVLNLKQRKIFLHGSLSDGVNLQLKLKLVAYYFNCFSSNAEDTDAL